MPDVISPVTNRTGIIVGRMQPGSLDVIQDLQEYRGQSVTYTSVTLRGTFQPTDGRFSLLSANDGPVNLPNSIAQFLIMNNAADAA